MSCTVYLSGAEKRKRAAKLNEAISSVPQLTSFFARNPSQSQSKCSISSREEELDKADVKCGKDECLSAMHGLFGF